MPLNRVEIIERLLEKIMYDGGSAERQELLYVMFCVTRNAPAREWMKVMARATEGEKL